jgi:glycosyltransferase involved in cell wall biosynthesis
MKQTFTDFEIIIVNAASTDDTVTLASAVIAAHPDRAIRLINQSDPGCPAINRSRGAHEARGNYALQLDPDDWIESDYLAKAVPILDDDPNVQIVFSDVSVFGDHTSEWVTGPFDFDSLLAGNRLPYCALYRKSLFETLDGYREGVKYEDWDFWIRAALQGFQARKIPGLLFHYRTHSGSVMTDPNHDPLLERALLALSVTFVQS